MTTRLNLACGPDYRKGWINIDNGSQYPGEKIDIKADIIKLKWENNTVDNILVIHYLMYLTPPELDRLLKRWYGWIKVGGEIQIETGNIHSVCNQILKAETVGELHEAMKQLYGWGNTHGHKWAWCPGSVKEALERAGFNEIVSSLGHYHGKPERDFVINAKKTLCEK
jgi:predicted SAM-dependent methyltransferase